MNAAVSVSGRQEDREKAVIADLYLAFADIAGLEPRDAAGEPPAYRSESFLQSYFWAKFKADTGWRAYHCRIDNRGREAANAKAFELFVLVKTLGLGYSFAYIPHGPPESIGIADPVLFLDSLSAAISASIGEKLLFLRFDLDWESSGKNGAALLSALARRAGRLRKGENVQVPDTVLLDLGAEENGILAGMKPKWRYNIKLAEKKGIAVAEEGQAGLEIFYDLYLQTARRDGIAIHPLSYYRKLFDAVENENIRGRGEAGTKDRPGPDLELWVARHEGAALAAIITLRYRGRATYLYGASSGEKRNLMPTYALQWRAIQAAKGAGCRDYDFFGIPPDDDPRHPMAGLFLFKTGFGGAISRRAGCVDYPAAPLAYALFRTAERLRLFWFKKVKKALRRRG